MQNGAMQSGFQQQTAATYIPDRPDHLKRTATVSTLDTILCHTTFIV